MITWVFAADESCYRDAVVECHLIGDVRFANDPDELRRDFRFGDTWFVWNPWRRGESVVDNPRYTELMKAKGDCETGRTYA